MGHGRTRTVSTDEITLHLSIVFSRVPLFSSRYRAITNAYYRGALGAVLVFDSTEQRSFENIPRWLGELRDHANRDIGLVMVGNKKDKIDEGGERQVTEEEAAIMAREFEVECFEASAKTGEGVEESFLSLVHSIYQKQQKSAAALAPQSNSSLDLLDKKEQKKCCN